MAIDMNEPFAHRRIHTDDDCYDVMYWSIRFGVSVERLVDAVAKVGPLVMNVERQLRLSAAVMADSSAANPHPTEVRDTVTPSFARAAPSLQSRLFRATRFG
jgi:Protein of unknown function (DUF3606)